MPGIKKNLIAIGKITKTIGVEGVLKAEYLTDFPERFRDIDYVFLLDEKKNKLLKHHLTGSEEYFIDSSNILKDSLRISFTGYPSKETAEKLTGSIIEIEEEKRVKLPEGFYYYYELADLKVFDRGKEIGIIKSVNNYGGSDVFHVILKNDGKEILIPYLKEFVKSVDLEKGRIDTELIDGFID
ncbi:16S rRNA processing protein RimM [bacterium]|nr:MAG: 16S rRNA processing protein RimM [bacterium]